MSDASPRPAPLPFSNDELERSIPERFARMVAYRPSALAIVSGKVRLTYAEVDRKADRLAAVIARHARGLETPVAVLLGDPTWTIIAMLATWKVGRPCVALDPVEPRARIEEMLRDSEAGLVFIDDGAAEWPRAGDVPTLTIEEIDFAEVVEPVRVKVSPDALACVVYTSGSTGQSKGVLRDHRASLQRARLSIMSLGISPDDRTSGLHWPSSGVGVRDVMAGLLAGATVFPLDLRRTAVPALGAWIKDSQITVLAAVTSTFRHILTGIEPGSLASVRIVRLGSEPLYRQDVERFRQRFPRHCVLVSGYGSTETIGIVEYKTLPETPLPAGRVPAGYPVDGVEVLLLGDDGEPVGPGEAGEVAVRSRYLALGYWRRPEETPRVFLSDPTDPALRIYLTGDIGRLSPDGCLDVLGRKDHQVKVRGYRVHPGEIELALLEDADIRDAVVVGRADANGDVRLTAYVVPKTLPGPATPEIRRHLRARLPAHMVPSTFVTLEALPLTASGKVDRVALSERVDEPPARSLPFVPLRSPLEHQIAEIWETVLNVRPIGRLDDFFDLGGDSLATATVLAAVAETCGHVLPPAALVDAPTVPELAAVIVRAEAYTNPISSLRHTGSGAPFFFLHGDFNGGGFYCRALASHLDRPFHAVHPHGLDGRPLPPTIEAMAADRARAVRSVQPHGPYLLGGHCNGGLVALEVARLLEAEGDRVDLVVIVEANAPEHAPRQSAGMRGLIRACARAPRRLVARALRGAWHRLAGGQTRDTAEHEDSSPTSGLAPYVRQQLYRPAMRRYMPESYRGPVVVLSAAEGPPRPPDLGWTSITPRLTVADIPGDHLTCITRHAGVFAKQLEDVLRDAESSRAEGVRPASTVARSQ